MNSSPFSQQLYDFHKSPIQKKSDEKYGLLIAKTLYDSIKSPNSTYFLERNRRFEENRAFASGNQPMSEYLDLLNIDGKQAFSKLDLTPPAIAPKFLEILIGRYMEREERPTVSAVDNFSKKEKQKRKDDAEFRMNHGELIGQLQQSAGVNLEDPNAYTPENYDDMALHFELEDRLPEEVCFEKTIKNVLDDSNGEIHKRALLRDTAICGMLVAKVFKDANGNEKYKRCKPDDVFYTYSNYDDFSDSNIKGMLLKMKITDVRTMYPNLTEEELYKMYVSSCQNGKVEFQWTSEYLSAVWRPYDDVVVDIFDFELVTTEYKWAVKSMNKYGKINVDEKKSRPANLAPDKELIEKEIAVVYKGVYAPGSQKMLEWKLAENMIKPHEALHEVFGSYCIVMPDNEDMRNMPIIERVKTPIRQMTLAHLKIQQLVAKMKPEGLLVDISGLTDVDLGLGRTEDALTLQQVYDQTGVQYYKSIQDDGETRQSAPIQPMENNSSVSKLQSLIETYNFYQNQLRDALGTNEYVEGQAVNPKTGLGVQQSQIQSSNRATEFIYGAYINLMNQVAKRISVLMWYNIVYAGKYSDTVSAEDVKERVFDINISMLPTDEQRQFFEEMLMKSITAGTIGTGAAFKVRRIAKENIKLAEIYLEKYEKEKMAKDIQTQQVGIQSTGAEQRASNKQTHDNAMELENLSGQIKLQIQKEINDGAKTNTLSTFVTSIMLEYLKSGKDLNTLPSSVQMLANGLFQNLAGSQQLQGIENQSTLQAMAQQQQAQQ